jgi:hypothetical protein
MNLRKQAFKMMRFVMLIKPPSMYFHFVLGIYLIHSNSAVHKQQCDSDQKISRSCV